MVLNVSFLLLVGCADDKKTENKDQPEVDPQTVVQTATESGLTPEERSLLARAKGREWEDYAPHDLEAYLTPRSDSTTAIFFWQPNSGAAKLKEVQTAFKGLDTLGVRTAVAVVAGGDDKAELIALRESQIYLPAFRVPRGGDYSYIDKGLPVGNNLVVSTPKSTGAKTFSSNTPTTAYYQLLKAQAPK